METESKFIKSKDELPSIKRGDIIVQVDPRYFRPTEVETLLGDPSKAKKDLNWTPKISFDELVNEMISHDLGEAKIQKSIIELDK